MSLTSVHRTQARVLAIAVALVSAFLLTVAGASPARADSSDDVARNVDVEIVIDTDGVAHITETYTWDFGTRQGLGFYRELVEYMGWEDDPDLMRQYVYSDYEVSSPSGAPAEVWVESRRGSVIQLSVGAPDGSSDTRTGEQTYVLSYSVDGALNGIRNQQGVDDQDEFYWNVFTDSAVLMENINVSITGPTDVVDFACYQGPAGSDERCTSYSADGSTATLQATDLTAGEGFTVMAAYQPGAIQDVSPILVENTSSGWSGGGGNAFTDFVGQYWPWLAGAWTAVLGGVIYRRYRKGRDLHFVGLPPNLLPAQGDANQYRVEPLTSEPPVTVQFHAPAGLTPAEGGVLLEESANPNHISATIVDLAVRGYLTLEEAGTNMFGKPNDWKLSRVPNPPSGADLKPFEASLLRSLFSGRASVNISDLSGSFASKVRKYTKDLTQISDSNSWYTRKGLVSGLGTSSSGRSHTTRVVFFVVMGLWVLGFVGGGSLAQLLMGGSVVVTIGLIIIAVISLIVALASTAKLAHARSAHGRALYEQVRGFKQYLETAEAHQLRWEQGEDIFSKYLPWAMVFGCADRWAKMFEQLAAEGVYTTMPIWYVSSRPFSPAAFSSMGNSITTFASSAPSTLSYTPGSSGGSGSFGGGGFGGGGFSGGGGGGGGVGGR